MNAVLIPLANNVPATVREQPLTYKYVSILAHEIRNPLTNISLSIHILKTGISDERLVPFLNIIDQSSKRIDELLKSLVNFRETNETIELQTPIHQFLDEVLTLTADRILLKQIKVYKNYAKQNYAFTFNRSQMHIAVTNIIINAIDAMTAGKGELSLLTKVIGQKYMIQIADNGCGIAKNDLKDIFNPLFTKRPGGLGFGLAATRDILISNHIHVTVKSELQKGTRFVLLFEKPFYAFPATFD